MEWVSEQERGEMVIVNLIFEFVEWLNIVFGIVWSLINFEMFVGIVDMYVLYFYNIGGCS